MEIDLELKETIERIRADWRDVISKKVPRGTLIGTLRNLFKEFNVENLNDVFRFVKEFIQNADDAESSEIKFKIEEDFVTVFNNGKPFTKDGIDSICGKYFSNKTPALHIGFLGIGFKSVFLISESVSIGSVNRESGKFIFFSFDKEKLKQEAINEVWEDAIDEKFLKAFFQVYPLLINEESFEIPPEYNVGFRIKLKNREMIKELTNWMLSENSINPRILLFLPHLQRIIIETSERKITYEKKLIENGENYEIFSISGGKENLYYLIFRKEYEVPQDILKKENELLEEYKRDKIAKREIYVAFKLRKDQNVTLEKENQATLHILPYSFVPLKQTPLSNLHFIPAGDFLADISKSRIILEGEWNRSILLNISKFIKEEIVPFFKRDERFKYNFLSVLWAEKTYQNIIDENLILKIQDFINSGDVFLTIDGKWVSKDKIVRVPPELFEIFKINKDPINKIKELIKDKEILDPRFELPESLNEELESRLSENIFYYLKEYFRSLVEKFETLPEEEKKDTILLISELYVNYLKKIRDSNKKILVDELIEELRGLKFKSKSGKIISIGELFLPSEISEYKLEEIVNKLREQLGEFFTEYVETGEEKRISYEFLDIAPFKDIINNENVKTFLRRVSRESKIDNQLGALRENLSYNIALLFIKKKKAGSKNVRFELILNPTDFLTLMGNDQIYVEVKSSINKEFVLERAQIDFILNPSNKVELIFVEDLKYDIEWIKVYEININNLSYYQWKVKMEDEIKAGECNLRELLNE